MKKSDENNLEALELDETISKVAEVTKEPENKVSASFKKINSFKIIAIKNSFVVLKDSSGVIFSVPCKKTTKKVGDIVSDIKNI